MDDRAMTDEQYDGIALRLTLIVWVLCLIFGAVLGYAMHSPG